MVNEDVILAPKRVKLLEAAKSGSGFCFRKKFAFFVEKCELKNLSKIMTSSWRHQLPLKAHPKMGSIVPSFMHRTPSSFGGVKANTQRQNCIS